MMIFTGLAKDMPTSAECQDAKRRRIVFVRQDGASEHRLFIQNGPSGKLVVDCYVPEFALREFLREASALFPAGKKGA